MPDRTRLFPSTRAIWLALTQLVMACGGQAVDNANGADTTSTGDDATSAAGGTETAGTGSEPSEGTGGTEASGSASTVNAATTGTGTTGSERGLRDAALERAARFVNDYGVACAEVRQVTFAEADRPSAYPSRVLQTRGHPGPFWECGQIADDDEKFACWDRLACDFEWWNELDWSQWSTGATVLEIIGIPPERINVASTRLHSFPDPSDPSAAVIGLSSFYEQTFAEAGPPGSHDCGYYWYLDPTPDGVALVLSSPMAGDLDGGLAGFQLDLCLTE